jgi:Zinc-binding dehydrogenase
MRSVIRSASDAQNPGRYRSGRLSCTAGSSSTACVCNQARRGGTRRETSSKHVRSTYGVAASPNESRFVSPFLPLCEGPCACDALRLRSADLSRLYDPGCGSRGTQDCGPATGCRGGLCGWRNAGTEPYRHPALWQAASSVGVRGDLDRLLDLYLTLHGILVRPEQRRLEALGRLVSTGALRPIIDQVLPLQEAAQAPRRLESGHGQGKIVLVVREQTLDAP